MSPSGTHQTTAQDREEVNGRIGSSKATVNARFDAVVAHNNLLSSKLSRLDSTWHDKLARERSLFETKLAQHKQKVQGEVLQQVQKLVDSVADQATAENSDRCQKCENEIVRLNTQLDIAQDTLRRIDETHIAKEQLLSFIDSTVETRVKKAEANLELRLNEHARLIGNAVGINLDRLSSSGGELGDKQPKPELESKMAFDLHHRVVKLEKTQATDSASLTQVKNRVNVMSQTILSSRSPSPSQKQAAEPHTNAPPIASPKQDAEFHTPAAEPAASSRSSRTLDKLIQNNNTLVTKVDRVKEKVAALEARFEPLQAQVTEVAIASFAAKNNGASCGNNCNTRPPTHQARSPAQSSRPRSQQTRPSPGTRSRRASHPREGPQTTTTVVAATATPQETEAIGTKTGNPVLQWKVELTNSKPPSNS